ncbi:uncharacterized protein LOC127257059 [Andrographis paniculata]|uniref:uncharacterized protein LOC127257059 n=1 Tax=Andrographis paniculata TaxID=175694 RepID=UPI0021E87873|nr:uncharacterized protein LOC127257059 [Andrographis paniculata]
MGLFKRLAGFLGIAKDDDDDDVDDHRHAAAIPPLHSSSVPVALAATSPPDHVPMKGFSVPVKVPVERAPIPPLLVFCPAGDGGIQGLRWYARRLKIDEDGDIADEFLDEVSPDSSKIMEEEHKKPLPRFKAKYDTKPAKVRNLSLLPNGKIQHLIEHRGKLEWL